MINTINNIDFQKKIASIKKYNLNHSTVMPI
jgi:hypothetical protein